ncbi:ras-related protein RABD1-like isoform X2 [Malus domestica]|uniref:ras-related protein RABD1-like isoform X2 n=1 Tax=Malus domestica TaxID=3750 RepID=UPI003976EEBA
METLWRSGPASSSSAPPASSNALSFPAYRVWIFDDASDSSSSSQLVVDGNRWNISTNYYTAGVSVWLVHLHDEFFIESLPMYEQLAALILVFDTTELSSLSALQEWVSQTDLQKFDILVCVGNKVDRVPGHPVRAEYRRRLQKLGDPFADAGPGFTAYGISETEGSSLLGDDEPFWGASHTCLEWCTEHNIEFVEACASNTDFDKCLSVDGDSQGIE